MAAEYPALDAIEADFLGVYVHLWATTTRLDSETPVGHPLDPACRVCAGSTVRLRQAVTKPVGGRRVALAWVCERCDASDSGPAVAEGVVRMSVQQTIWPDDQLHDPSWERIKARLECDAPVWVVNRHPADGRALPGWSWCGECPRCEATLDENGEKP